jgi:FlaG/FlaF family flagellin (archaellin)
MALFDKSEDVTEVKSGTEKLKQQTDLLKREDVAGSETRGSVTAAEQETRQRALSLGAEDAVTSLLKILSERAGTDITELAKPLLDETTRSFEEDTMAQINQLFGRVGSKLNTFAPQVIAKGRQDLATRQGAIVAELMAKARGEELGAIPGLVQGLRGAETVTTSGTRQESQDTLNRILQTLTGQVTDTEALTTTVGKASAERRTGRDLIDFLNVFA